MGLAEFDKKRQRRRKRDVRKKTESVRQIRKNVNDAKIRLLPVLDEFDRPQTRAECKNQQRPCPFVSCRWNLYLDVSACGSILFNFPDLEPDQMPHDASCVLDIADRGGETLPVIAEALNITRERVRQIEDKILAELKEPLKEWRKEDSGEPKSDEREPVEEVDASEIDYFDEQKTQKRRGKSRPSRDKRSYNEDFRFEAPNATIRTMVSREYARRYGGSPDMPYWSRKEERELRVWLESPWAEWVAGELAALKPTVVEGDTDVNIAPETQATGDEPMPVTKRHRGGLQQQILAHLSEKNAETKPLAAALGTSMDNVRHALARLESKRLVVKTAYGAWTLVRDQKTPATKKRQPAKEIKTRNKRAAVANGQTSTSLQEAIDALRHRRTVCEDEIRRIDGALKKLESH